MVVNIKAFRPCFKIHLFGHTEEVSFVHFVQRDNFAPNISMSSTVVIKLFDLIEIHVYLDRIFTILCAYNVCKLILTSVFSR